LSKNMRMPDFTGWISASRAMSNHFAIVLHSGDVPAMVLSRSALPFAVIQTHFDRPAFG